MVDAAAELVVAADDEVVAVDGGGAVGGELAGHQRHAVGEHVGDAVVGEVGAEERRR